ncbi:MAG: hypothetical protein ACKO4X_11855, partial [Alphaproteobacteria bacterium]
MHGFSAGIKDQNAFAWIALRPIRHARCNRAAEAGAEAMGSVAAVAAQCSVVFACLPSAETSERVAL